MYKVAVALALPDHSIKPKVLRSNILCVYLNVQLRVKVTVACVSVCYKWLP